MKDLVRPIYQELQGNLSQIPLPKDPSDLIYDNQRDLWDKYNALVTELSKITGKDYDRHKVSPRNEGYGEHLSFTTLRAGYGGLISRLHAEYFNSEATPFGGTPSTIISQTQTQQQNIDIKLLIDLGSKVDEKLKETKDENEKGFLGKIKSVLPNLKSGIEVLRTTIDLAKEFGLTADQLSNLLK